MIGDVERCHFRPLPGTKVGQFSADLNRREELSDRLRCASPLWILHRCRGLDCPPRGQYLMVLLNGMYDLGTFEESGDVAGCDRVTNQLAGSSWSGWQAHPPWPASCSELELKGGFKAPSTAV
jgi:hypothetical protein